MLIRLVSVAWWLMAISFPIAFLAGAFGWFDDPRLGVSVAPLADGRMVITDTLPGGPVDRLSSAKPGDILIEVDGLVVTKELISERGTTGTSFAIVSFDSQGRRSGVFRGAEDPSISSTAIAISILIIGVVFAITSFFVFFRSARSPEISVLSLLLITLAIAFVISPASAHRFHWPSLVGALAVIWSAGLFVVFFYLFPARQGFPKFISATALYGGPLGALAITVMYVLAFETRIDVYGIARQLGIVYVALGFLGGIAFLAFGSAKTESTVSREQFRIVVAGIVSGILPFILLTVVPQSLGISSYVRPEISVLGIVILPLSLAFAIHRHHFMEIRRLVHRGAAYALISFTVLIVYGLLIGTIRVMAGTEVSESLGLQITLMVLLFAVMPFILGSRRLAFAAVDQLLYREYVEHPELTRRLSVDAATAQSAEELSSNVLAKLASEFRLSFAGFGSVNQDTINLSSSVGTVPPKVRENLITLAKGQSNEAVTYSERPLDGNSGDAMMVEVKRIPNLTWFLCLGPKITEEPFSHEDEGLAQSIAGHLTTVSEKLDLLNQLQTKNVELTEFNHRLVETEEAERSRIASYLHNEPLQDISSLAWRFPNSEIPEDVGLELQRIAENLRNFTARLQPAQLTDLGLVRSLEWLSAEAGAAGGFKSSVDAGFLGRNNRLDHALEVALYRIAQEALANCQYHSKATNVWVQLTSLDNEVILVIEDDGVGFARGSRPDASKQLGLIGMRERANQLGGRFDIEQRQPRGTKIMVALPCGDVGHPELSDKAGL